MIRIIHHVRPIGVLYQVPDLLPVRIVARKEPVLERSERELADWWKSRQRLSFDERAEQMRRRWGKK